MNSKERVRSVIDRKPVDKVPLGFYVVDCDIIEKVIGRKTYVRDKIGSQLAFWEGRRDEVVDSYKEDTVDFYKKIDCADLITFKEAPMVPPKGYKPNPPRKIGDNLWKDREGRVYKASVISNELVCVEDPTLKPPEAFSTHMFPVPDESDIPVPDPSIFEACDYIIEQLGKDRYIAGTSGGFTAMTLLGGQETGLMLYALKPDVVQAANSSQMIRQNKLDRLYIRPGQDGVLLEQDMAGTNGPLVSPAAFKTLCFPYLRDRVTHIKRCGKQVLLHNCGDNRLLMGMMVDAGIQVFQSLQTNAGMELNFLLDAYGRSMVFWGGISVEYLISGTVEEVKKDVREALDKAKRVGNREANREGERGENGRKTGVILGPSHSIAYGTRYDNFMAMLDEYQKNAFL